jgi:hypothetical protein
MQVARRLNRAASVKAAAIVGIPISKIFLMVNIKRKIYPHHEAWCRANGYKPTSPQAQKRKKKVHKLRVGPPVLIPSLQAQGSGNPDKV